ncbi:Xaa-Pro peptidase family protein [Thalassoglobus sp. JC818]|uniref:M24 family metallopeptidase n=1 Tax=Thalassoglobus sp. JC818 TaxID=3232136 RepID=UPI00345812F5
MAERHAARRDRVREQMRRDGVDAFLITTEKNVAYLTGFTGDSTWMLLTLDSAQLVSDFRYTTQLASECPDVSAVIRPSNKSLIQGVVGELQSSSSGPIGFEGHSMPFDTYQQLIDGSKGQQWVPLSWKVETIRAIKDDSEIEEIRLAVRLAEEGFAQLLDQFRPDATEREMAYELEHIVRGLGGEELSFHPIIAVGDHSAMPHYRPGDRKLSEHPILLVDWGAQTYLGYKSDLTRTLLTQDFPEPQFEKIYRTVLEAQMLAIDLIGPGVSTLDVDTAARQHIADAGFGEFFDHGLGHGIGLDIHELPRFSRTAETPLETGMVVTVEPGIYLSGWGGVRIEDDVLVTDQGCEVLSSVTKSWDSVRITI